MRLETAKAIVFPVFAGKNEEKHRARGLGDAYKTWPAVAFK